MKFVEIGGVQVSYRVDGDGPGLVLVHGTGGNADTNWAHLLPVLTRRWTVVRPNYSGSGETRDNGGPLAVEALAAQVVGAAQAAGAVPFDLVGFSLGAGWRLASRPTIRIWSGESCCSAHFFRVPTPVRGCSSACGTT